MPTAEIEKYEPSNPARRIATIKKMSAHAATMVVDAGWSDHAGKAPRHLRMKRCYVRSGAASYARAKLVAVAR